MGTTSIRIQPDLIPPLESLANEVKRSKNWLINEAIREYLNKHKKEIRRWEETLVALDSIKKGREIPEKEVEDWLNSWGADNELNPPKL